MGSGATRYGTSVRCINRLEVVQKGSRFLLQCYSEVLYLHGYIAHGNPQFFIHLDIDETCNWIPLINLGIAQIPFWSWNLWAAITQSWDSVHSKCLRYTWHLQHHYKYQFFWAILVISLPKAPIINSENFKWNRPVLSDVLTPCVGAFSDTEKWQLRWGRTHTGISVPPPFPQRSSIAPCVNTFTIWILWQNGVCCLKISKIRNRDNSWMGEEFSCRA